MTVSPTARLACVGLRYPAQRRDQGDACAHSRVSDHSVFAPTSVITYVSTATTPV